MRKEESYGLDFLDYLESILRLNLVTQEKYF